MNQKLLKSQTILAICILILSIIPIVAIGPYLHQFADDYVFRLQSTRHGPPPIH